LVWPYIFFRCYAKHVFVFSKVSENRAFAGDKSQMVNDLQRPRGQRTIGGRLWDLFDVENREILMIQQHRAV